MASNGTHSIDNAVLDEVRALRANVAALEAKVYTYPMTCSSCASSHALCSSMASFFLPPAISLPLYYPLYRPLNLLASI